MGTLLNLVGLSTGVVLYAMLLLMVLRAQRLRSTDSTIDPLPLVTAVLGLIWNVSALSIYELPVAGVRGPLPYLSWIGYSALGFLPAVVVHSVLRSSSRGSEALMRELLTAAGYAASAVASVFHLHALATSQPVPSVDGMQLLTYTYVALVAPVALLTRRQPRARQALWMAGLAAFAVSALHVTVFRHSENDPWLIELLGHHASVPLALAILYQDYPFALADLFLKRALTLVALVTLAVSGMAILGVPYQARDHAPIGSLAVSAVVVLWVATALFYPMLRSRVSWFVDAIVLGRPDHVRLRAAVANEITVNEHIAPLLDGVCRALAPAFGAEALVWDTSTDREHVGGGGACTVTESRTAARCIVETNDAPHYVITVPPLKGGRRLLSDDIALLEAVGVMLARRIDAIRLLEERHAHEMHQQEISKLATEAELRALRAQINPHFLFNALTTIGYLIQAAPARALDTLMQLTILLRGVLRSEGAFTTLERELDLVESYLEIERARFEDRLQVHVDIPRELRQTRLPPLILQPLVENAVKHGVTPQRTGTEVSIRASLNRKDGDQHELILTVHDTGVGVTEASLEQGRIRGLGLNNIEQRLARQYGRHASLSVTSAPGMGTTAKIRLPVRVWAEEAAVQVDR